MKHSSGWALAAYVSVVFVSTSLASQIVKKTIQEKARQADLVLIAKVHGLHDSGEKDEKHGFEKWIADCTVIETLDDNFTNKEVRVGFLLKLKDDNRELPEGDRLDAGRSYILFLKQNAGQISLIAPWDASMEVAENYSVWDENLKNDEKAIRRSTCTINGVPSVTRTHADLIKTIQVVAKQRAANNASQPTK